MFHRKANEIQSMHGIGTPDDIFVGLRNDGRFSMIVAMALGLRRLKQGRLMLVEDRSSLLSH